MAISMLKIRRPLGRLILTWELPYLVRPSFLLRRPPESGIFRDNDLTWIILGMGSANERRRYIITSSLIGWAIPRMIPGSVPCLMLPWLLASTSLQRYLLSTITLKGLLPYGVLLVYINSCIVRGINYLYNLRVHKWQKYIFTFP